jgi:hypothetical protein
LGYRRHGTLLRYDSGGFGGLDLSRDCEDPRTPFSGDKFSAGRREVAKTDGGFSFLEVQRELRESELRANARATGEVLTAEQPSNNDKGGVENTIQVLAELKKQQREPPFKQGATDGCTRAIHGASRDPGD